MSAQERDIVAAANVDTFAVMGERTGMLLIAVALPSVANQLDAIPAVGSYLNSILDNVAVGVAGMYLANFTIALVGRIKPA